MTSRTKQDRHLCVVGSCRLLNKTVIFLDRNERASLHVALHNKQLRETLYAYPTL